MRLKVISSTSLIFAAGSGVGVIEGVGVIVGVAVGGVVVVGRGVIVGWRGGRGVKADRSVSVGVGVKTIATTWLCSGPGECLASGVAGRIGTAVAVGVVIIVS